MPPKQSKSQHSDAIQMLARLIKILTVLRSRSPKQPLSRNDLAQACSCDKRTIQRDLKLLDEAGIIITYDRSLRAYTLPETGWVYPTVPLTIEDALTLALSRALLSTDGLPLQDSLSNTLDKVIGALPPILKALTAEIKHVIKAGTMARDYSNAPLKELTEAAIQKRTLQIDYDSRSGKNRKWRFVDPYGVEQTDGRFLELHAWDHLKQKILTFALDRIMGIRHTDTTFVIQQQAWDAFRNTKGVVGGLRGGTRVSVEVIFSPEAVPFALARQWSEALTIQKNSDGSAELTGSVQGVDGLIKDLLSWRRLCYVRGGPELKERMREEVRAMAKLYEE